MSESIRKVSTIFTLDDSEHNRKLKEINAQYKLTQSEIKLAGERLDGFGKNTENLKYKQEALAKQTETLKDKINLYRDSIEKASTRAEENNKKLQDLKKSKEDITIQYKEAVKIYGQESEQAQKLKEELNNLNTEYQEQKTVVDKNVNTVNNYKTKLNETEAQLTKVEAELKKTSDTLDKQNNKWLVAGENLKKAGDKLKTTGEKMSEIGGKLTKTVTLPILAIGTAAVKAQIDFESAFAGVKKTVDGTTEQLKALEDGIKNMSKELPSSAEDIAAVAESAGQLGIQTDNILGFTRTIIDLGNATNLIGEEGASQLAKFANITRMSQKDFDRLGSTIVALGNNLATTEADIVSMGMRLAGAGKQIGLSEAQIMGFAGALSSVGIEAEAGGSAFSKLMIEMKVASEVGGGKAKQVIDKTGMSLRQLEMLANADGKAFKAMANDMGYTSTELKDFMKSAKNLENFSKVVGMTGDEFKRAFEKNAVGAISMFIDGLANAEKQGKTAVTVLDEMGITEIRLRDALLRAAGASEVFNNAIDIGSNAWKDNTALANEANQRYATTESQLKILKNEIVGMAREIGVQLLPVVKDGLVVVKDLIEKFNALSPSTKENIIKFAALAAVTGPVIGGVGKVAQGLGSVMSIAGKVSTVLGGASAATATVGTASTVAAGTAGAGGLAGLASGLGGVVVAAAPYVLAGAAIAGAGYMVYKGLTEEVVPAVDLFADKIETTASTVTDEYGNMTASIETNTIKISEATKTAVGAYIKMDDDATNTLTNLYVNSAQITQDTVASLTTKYTEMGNQIKAGIDKRYNEMYSTMDTFFKNGAALTESEEKLALTSLQTNNNAKKIEVDRYTKEIQDILNNASKNNRALTLEEQQQINSIQEKMRVNAVNTLSETEVESKVILERLKNYSTRITAEQAAEIIKNANNTRDKAVQAANTQYDKTVASIIKMRDETKSITSDQADKLIKEAARQRDEAVNKAEELRSGVVNKLKQMNPDVEKEVNMQTGKIMTAWDKVKNWWNNLWFPKKTMEVQTKYTSSGQMNSLYKQYSGGIPMNALGTNYFQGGLTYLNERGYEVVELPRGSKVKNHLQSENMIKDTAIQTAKAIAGLINNDNSNNIELHVYLGDKEIIDKTTKQVVKSVGRSTNNYRKGKGGLAFG